MAYRNGPKIITDGLVLCLDAAIGKSYPGSGTTWYDLSTSKINGTLTNGPTFSSANNGVLNFDGSNDYIETSDVTLDLTNGFTVSQWFNATNISSNPGIFSYRNGLNNLNIILVTNNYRIRMESYSGGGQLYSSSSIFDLNKWYNVVCTFSGTDTSGSSGLSKIYLNGISIASGTTNGFGSTTAKVIIGVHSGGYFQGYISNTMFYINVLSADEVARNFNATRGRFGV
jgi:hypothetical protein